MSVLITAQQHVYGFEGRTAETIFVAGFGALVLVALLVMRMSLRNWLLVATLFATSIAASVDNILLRYNPTWMFAAQVNHASIHLACGLALGLIVGVTGGFNVQNLTSQGVLMFLMAVYAGLMQFIHEGANEALQAIGFAIGTIPTFVFAVGMSSRTYEGCTNLLRMFMWVSVLWTFCCSVQFVMNPSYLVSYQGRFLGMLGNAQHAAALSASMAVIAIWLLMHDPQRRTKILWVALIAINLLFLAWSASRTGALMFIVGATCVLYTRAGKAVFLLPVAGLMVWLLGTLAGALQIGANLERFVSTDNTRDWVWLGQINAAMESPLIGVGWRGGEVGTENSYLGSLAAYGIFYFLMTMSLLVISMWQCLQLHLKKQWLAPEHRPLVDVFIGFNAMFFAGAFFEGYILARSFIPQFILLTFAAIGAWMLREISYNQQHAHEFVHPDEHAEYGEYGEDPALAHE